MKEQIELKPCPFCGGEAYLKLVSKSYGDHYGATFAIGCADCRYQFKEESRWAISRGEMMIITDGYEKCIERWNRRADNEQR